MSHYVGDSCHTGHEQDSEIVRLRAEVKAWTMLASSPQEVLDRVIALQRERDEALAQVAALCRFLRHLLEAYDLTDVASICVKDYVEEIKRHIRRGEEGTA